MTALPLAVCTSNSMGPTPGKSVHGVASAAMDLVRNLEREEGAEWKGGGAERGAGDLSACPKNVSIGDNDNYEHYGARDCP